MGEVLFSKHSMLYLGDVYNMKICVFSIVVLVLAYIAPTVKGDGVAAAEQVQIMDCDRDNLSLYTDSYCQQHNTPIICYPETGFGYMSCFLLCEGKVYNSIDGQRCTFYCSGFVHKYCSFVPEQGPSDIPSKEIPSSTAVISKSSTPHSKDATTSSAIPVSLGIGSPLLVGAVLTTIFIRRRRKGAQGNDDRENQSVTSGSSGNAEQISMEEHEERTPFRSVHPEEGGDNASIRSDESVGPEDEGLVPSGSTHGIDIEASTIDHMLPHPPDKQC